VRFEGDIILDEVEPGLAEEGDGDPRIPARPAGEVELGARLAVRQQRQDAAAAPSRTSSRSAVVAGVRVRAEAGRPARISKPRRPAPKRSKRRAREQVEVLVVEEPRASSSASCHNAD
jgi:hypothetical protein